MRTSDRTDFRVFARSDRVCAIALFCDTRDGKTTVKPSDADVIRMVRAASLEVRDEIKRKVRVCIALVRSDDNENVQQSVTHVIDENNQTPTHSAIMHLQMWHIKELQYDAVGHKDQNPQRKATKNEYGKLLAKHFPLIYESDVISRWLLFEVGDVIREDRPDARLGSRVYYRRVTRKAEHVEQ